MYKLTDPNKKIEFEYVPAAAHILVVKNLNGVKLNGDAKLLYLKMWKESFYYEGLHGVYKPSNEDLAYSLGVTEKSIRNNIAKLKEAGLVIQLNDTRTGGTNCYKMIDWRAVEEIISLKLPKEARQEAIKQKNTSVDVVEDAPVSVITPEPIILPKTVTVIPVSPPVIVETEPMNEPVKANNNASISEQSSPIPVTHEKLSEGQLKMYCEITNQNPKHVLNQLEKEPSAIGYILEMLEGKATEKRNAERDALTIKNAKTGYEHKGNNPIPQEQAEDAWGGMF